MQFLGHDLGGSLILAPMAGVTDPAFRTVCAELGAAVTVTEMVSSRALVYQDKKSRTLLRKNRGSLCGAQLFGNDPEIMALAAVLALEYSHCDFIDINMGCPMPKVVNNGDGCALMRDPLLAGRIVAAVSRAVPVPVTVKMRLGWDKSSVNAPTIAHIVQESGAQAVAVHGRTKTMLYAGKADWDAIGEVVRAVDIPVIANGDLCSSESLLRCRAHTGAKLFMLGRGTLGDPWLFSELNAALRGEPSYMRPPLSERMDVAARQFSLALADKGEHIACLEARKHLAWYLRGVAHSAYYKDEVSHLTTFTDVEEVIKRIKRDLR